MQTRPPGRRRGKKNPLLLRPVVNGFGVLVNDRLQNLQRQLGTSSAIYSQLQFIEESIDLLEPTIEESSKSIKNDT